MLIGLCGGQHHSHCTTPHELTAPIQGICAGKRAIAGYLIEHQGFRLLELASKPPRRISDEPDDESRLEASQIRKDGDARPEFVFDTADSLLDFATRRWQERWVTTDIADGATLDGFLLRPFFLLVSVDAPVSLRWKRFSDRFVTHVNTLSAPQLILS